MPARTFNWEGLPQVVKIQCIKNMEFRTSMCLSTVSHAERELVLSQPFLWKFLGILVERNGTENDMEVYAETKREDVRSHSRRRNKTVNKRIVALFKYCHFENVLYEAFKDYSDSKLFPNVHSPIHCHNIWVNCDDYGHILEFLEKNETPLKKLCIEESYGVQNLKEFADVLGHPKVLEAKFLQLQLINRSKEYDDPSQYDVILKKWIEHDVPIGRKLLFLQETPTVFKELKENFKNRIFYKSSEMLLLRTDNDTKYILIIEKEGVGTACTVIESSLTVAECLNVGQMEEWKKESLNDYN